MPELPEVEIVKQEIDDKITKKKLKKIVIREHRFRWPINTQLVEILKNKIILKCSRRGKYILIHFEHGIQLIHLGMSGSLRFSEKNKSLEKHDHVEWFFDNFNLRLNDPRRFGAVLWHPHHDGPITDHPLIKNMGLEPFDDEFNGKYLIKKFKNLNSNIKQTLLSGKIVVGVGNIYASESLFKAKINPTMLTKDLSNSKCELLAQEIKETLYNAIKAGGSTLKNFVSTNGTQGNFIKDHAYVYNRHGKPCLLCTNGIILKISQNNRTTYYCPHCQN